MNFIEFYHLCFAYYNIIYIFIKLINIKMDLVEEIAKVPPEKNASFLEDFQSLKSSYQYGFYEQKIEPWK